MFIFQKLVKNILVLWIIVTELTVRQDAFTFPPVFSQRFARSSRVFQSTKSSTPKTDVVFSKVVRPIPNQETVLFLPQLVEYLQVKFRLPPNLPMIYDYEQGSNGKHVVSWYSPLSSSADETRLSVEVVAIQTDDENDKSLPVMAMVAVHKKMNGKSSGAPAMTSLFADSEKKILRALDRGLDQFSAGKVLGLTTSVPSSSTWMSISRQFAEDEEYNSRTSLSDEVITSNNDETFAAVKETAKPIVKNSETSDLGGVDAVTGRQAATNKNSPVANISEDYAVAAARAAAKSKINDFAVDTAKAIASKIKNNQIHDTAGLSKGERSQSRNIKKQPDESKLSNTIPPDSERKLSGPSWTISSPKGRKKKQKVQIDEPSSTVEVSEVIQDIRDFGDYSHIAASSNVFDAEIVPENKGSSPRIDSNRKLNVKVVDEQPTHLSEFPFPPIDPRDIEAKQDDPIEVRKAKEAQRMMSEIAEQGQDVTAEELLRDVLKFGEEKEKETQVGTGFVSGAFEKAKELLRDQKQQREEREFKVINNVGIGINLDIADPEDDLSTSVEDLTLEEELKRIFRAGERLAESRIELNTPDGRQLTAEQDQLVDNLVAKDKTISTYARTLDEELVELEIRINRNPDEDMDGTMKNPVFDVLSGPEVYNPNVDPETAVNWPGALPGRKTIRFPKELDEAVKQANFAADVIMKMREEQVEDTETGEVNVNYFVGDRPLSHAEVLNLKTVVAESVKLGILKDPVLYMAERSRLAIIIDELWHQPEERFREIAENYKDLLLSENFVDLLKERLTEMANRDRIAFREGNTTSTWKEFQQRHEREREILGQLVVYAQLLLKEVRALGAALEAQQVEVIRSICKVAMDPAHVTEEETACALTDAVRDMRPLFDDGFVAYIKFAIAEEEGRLARAGVLDDPEHNQWLMVLQIVQQGVYAEIAKGINRYIEHIWYILRMETRQQRRSLLSEIIDNMPTLDVRPFVQVVDNIASSLGDAVKGDTDPVVLGEMTNSILQLHRDVHDLLPPARINEMAKDADEWAAKQRQRLLEQRNLTKKRLQQARETEPLTDAILKRASGEIDRFE